MSAGGAPEGGNVPVPVCFVLAKDIQIAVIGIDPEPALRWREPAIDHGVHGDPALPEPERDRLLFAAIAGVAVYANRHGATMTLRSATGCDRYCAGGPVVPSEFSRAGAVRSHCDQGRGRRFPALRAPSEWDRHAVNSRPAPPAPS